MSGLICRNSSHVAHRWMLMASYPSNESQTLRGAAQRASRAHLAVLPGRHRQVLPIRGERQNGWHRGLGVLHKEHGAVCQRPYREVKLEVCRCDDMAAIGSPAGMRLQRSVSKVQQRMQSSTESTMPAAPSEILQDHSGSSIDHTCAMARLYTPHKTNVESLHHSTACPSAVRPARQLQRSAQRLTSIASMQVKICLICTPRGQPATKQRQQNRP